MYCVAWVLMNTGDEKLGSALLRQAISYIDDSLPLAVEHSDWDNPEVCYLMAGDTEKALLSIETQLSHNHLYAWKAVQPLVPMFDQIRHEPRYQAVWAEYERRISSSTRKHRKNGSGPGALGVHTTLSFLPGSWRRPK